MSYNGSGTFQINTSGQPVVAGTVISSTAFNALTADLATGLSTAITKDGQTTTTARIPFAAGINSSSTTDSSSTSTGSIITAGGVGVAKALYVGTTANVAGAATLGSTLTYGGVTLTNAVTGTGKMVLDTSPTLVTPNLGTPANGILTNCTGINYDGFKNRIINGAMEINQRATTITSAISGAYTVDRWNTYFDQSYSIAQIADAPSGYTYSLKVTKTNTTQSTYAFLVQYIEGLNAVDLAFGTATASTVTLSFWVKSSITGNFAASLTNSAENRSYAALYNIASANTWEQKTITIAGDTSGTWLKTNGKGISVQFNFGAAAGANAPSTWLALNNLAPTGSVNLGTTNNSTFQITGVQLEKGSTATSFDYRPYGTELALCQRYLPAFRADSGNWRLPTAAVCGATNQIYATVIFPVTTRVKPTGVTVSAAANFNGGVDGIVANTTFSTLVFSSVSSTQAARILGTTATSPFTAGQSAEIEINSGGYIYFDGCEL